MGDVVTYYLFMTVPAFAVGTVLGRCGAHVLLAAGCF